MAFTQGFTLAGSSLQLLNIGERGIITSLRDADDCVRRKLSEMGVRPGQSITVEQRFPRFVINVGGKKCALNSSMIRSIYVRLTKL